LLTGIAAADIFSIHHHARSQVHQGPRVPRVRQGHDHVLGDVDADLGFLDIDDGRMAGDRDGFGDRRLLHSDVHGHVASERNDLLISSHGFEPGHFEFDRIVAGYGQIQESEISLFRSDRGSRGGFKSRQGDGDAGQRRALFVNDRSPDAAEFLAENRARCKQNDDKNRTECSHRPPRKENCYLPGCAHMPMSLKIHLPFCPF